MLWDIAIELGCSAVRMATREHGLAFSAPSWGAMQDGRLTAIGEEALDMLGRTPPDVRLVRPVEHGVISEPRLAGQWLRRLMAPFTSGTRVTRPAVALLDNGLMHQAERETLVGTVAELGAGRCGFLSSDLAAAIGANVNPRRPEGVAVANIGADTLSVSLISSSRVIMSDRIPMGMNRVQDGIRHLVRQREGLSIGPRTAEELMLALATALPAREITARAVGLDDLTGFPGTRDVAAATVREAVDPVLDALTRCAFQVIQSAPEELSADLYNNGLILTGGGALLSGLDSALSQRLGIRCVVAETPMLCTGKGMARVLQDGELSDMLISQA